MRFEEKPPAVENVPPANSATPEGSGVAQSISARTSALGLLPTPLHVAPSQRARNVNGACASENVPPAYKRLPPPSSCAPKHSTLPFKRPLPTCAHAVPS